MQLRVQIKMSLKWSGKYCFFSSE